MRFDDITYVLDDKAIMPKKMGVIATDIYDASKSLKYYEESIPEVRNVMEICNQMHTNDDFDNIIAERIEPQGFYKKYVHFFILRCEEDTNITYIVKAEGSDNRTWIDGELKIIGLDQIVFTLGIKKGISVICIEHAFDILPYVRLEKVCTPFNKVNPLTKGNYWYRQCDYYIDNSNFLFNGESFTFKLIPIDLVHLTYDKIVQMQIKASDDSIVYEHDNLGFAKEYCFNLSMIPNMNEDEYECLHVCFKVEGIKNTEKKLKLYRFPPNPQYTEIIKSQALMLLEDENLPDLIHDEIEYCLNVLKSVNNHTYYGRFLKEIITAYNEKSIDEYLYKPGSHNIFYFSDIDANYHYYYVVLPPDYDPSKSYPLILTIAHGYIDKYSNKNYSYRFVERPGAIYADIGGIGNNFGSYLGEAFIKEEIQHLLNHFPIDSKRIYVTGNCGGNWAAYNFLQNYPHMFAGAYTITAHPDIKRMKNLYNINWIHAVATVDESPKDPMQMNRKFIESNLKNFNYLFVQRLDNPCLPRAQYTDLAIEMLMCKDLIEYPEIIYYRTTSNRTRMAYYIEIESIIDGKDFAEFNSEIVAYSLVINAKNCTGLKIKLPPQIDRRNFVIKINGKSIKFEWYYQDVVCLKHFKNKGFIVVDRLDNEITNYKGAGLLDVYLSPMRIINCCVHNAEMTKVANAFAHPVTNTVHPDIYVDYPICAADNIVNYKNYALIVIDSNQNVNADLKFVRSKLPIQMDKQGYKYNGQFIEGKYCIMQVISNPWYGDKSILYINTNDVELYRKNLFTRSMVIPTYNSGKHPYLNGVALLFDGKKYYSINKWNNNIFEIM